MSRRPSPKFNAAATAKLIAASKDPDVAKALTSAREALAAHANVDAVDERNATPIYNAVENANLGLVELLIEHNANVNKAIPLDSEKFFLPSMEPWEPAGRVYDTPLHCVTKCASLERDAEFATYKKIAEALIKAGASLRVLDANKCTPFESADHYIGVSGMSDVLAKPEGVSANEMRRNSQTYRPREETQSGRQGR